MVAKPINQQMEITPQLIGTQMQELIEKRRLNRCSHNIDDATKRKVRNEFGKKQQKLIRRELAAQKSKMMEILLNEFQRGCRSPSGQAEQNTLWR